MTTTVQILRTGLASALVALAGLASAAQASDLIGDEQATTLDMAEVMIDAARSFELVDVNVDGVKSAEPPMSSGTAAAST